MAIARRFVLTNASCAENGVMWKFSCATNSWKTASDMFYVICLCYWQDIIIGTQKQLSISAQNYQITDKFKNLWMFKIWSPPVTNCIFYNPINWRLIFTSQHLQHIFRFTHLCSRAFSLHNKRIRKTFLYSITDKYRTLHKTTTHKNINFAKVCNIHSHIRQHKLQTWIVCHSFHPASIAHFVSYISTRYSAVCMLTFSY